MFYDVQVSNIHEDYTITNDRAEVWTRTTEDPAELIRLLNRIAIATTQFPVLEFPEVRVSWESRHAQIRVIKGKLFYSELSSSNRKDLVVTPDEVVRLLEGQTVEQALHRDPEEGVYVRPKSGGHGGGRHLKNAFLFVLLALLSGSIFYSWKSVGGQARLVHAPDFTRTKEKEGTLFRQYADVYVSELREGGTVLELTEKGLLSIYELWYSHGKREYNLMPMDDYSVSAGLHRGAPALLAGEIHLLELSGDLIQLHGVTFKRHGQELSSLGEVLESGF